MNFDEKNPHKKITWKNKPANKLGLLYKRRKIGGNHYCVDKSFAWPPIPSDKYQGKYLFDMAGTYFKITPVYLTWLVYI
jgi:hypothetical protein